MEAGGFLSTAETAQVKQSVQVEEGLEQARAISREEAAAQYLINLAARARQLEKEHRAAMRLQVALRTHHNQMSVARADECVSVVAANGGGREWCWEELQRITENTEELSTKEDDDDQSGATPAAGARALATTSPISVQAAETAANNMRAVAEAGVGTASAGTEGTIKELKERSIYTFTAEATAASAHATADVAANVAAEVKPTRKAAAPTCKAKHMTTAQLRKELAKADASLPASASKRALVLRLELQRGNLSASEYHSLCASELSCTELSSSDLEQSESEDGMGPPTAACNPGAGSKDGMERLPAGSTCGQGSASAWTSAGSESAASTSAGLESASLTSAGLTRASLSGDAQPNEPAPTTNANRPREGFVSHSIWFPDRPFISHAPETVRVQPCEASAAAEVASVGAAETLGGALDRMCALTMDETAEAPDASTASAVEASEAAQTLEAAQVKEAAHEKENTAEAAEAATVWDTVQARAVSDVLEPEPEAPPRISPPEITTPDTSPREITTPFLAGEFVKQGQCFPWTWRRRSFEVTAGRGGRPCLAYYHGGAKKGSMELAKVWPQTAYLWRASTSPLEIVFEAADGKRQLRARAPSEEVRDAWLSRASLLLKDGPGTHTSCATRECGCRGPLQSAMRSEV